ncbi:HAD family hydrolase [Lachnospiraceae bacterium LCP25S3_G4]
MKHLKPFKYAIFDLDGTLIDSMSYWAHLGTRYLKSRGLCAKKDLQEAIRTMSLEEAAVYFQEVYGLEGTVESIVDEIHQFIEIGYRTKIPLKEGVKEYIEILSQREVKMCVATATSKELAELALTRLGIMKYFSFIMDCKEAGIGKHHPNIYLMCATKLKQEKENIIEDIIIFEDAEYALETAYKAGFYTIGIQENKREGKNKTKCGYCHVGITHFQELWEE